jgi:hypothetical protein
VSVPRQPGCKRCACGRHLPALVFDGYGFRRCRPLMDRSARQSPAPSLRLHPFRGLPFPREPAWFSACSSYRCERADPCRRHACGTSLRGCLGGRDCRRGCAFSRAMGAGHLRGRPSGIASVHRGGLDGRPGPSARATTLSRSCSRLEDRDRSNGPDHPERPIGAARDRSHRVAGRGLAGRPGQLCAL